MAEWIVADPDGVELTLQLAYFDRACEPVVMEVGPVLDIEDVAGGKVCALASRVEPRDYADTARMLGRYSPAQLIGLARRLDPGLEARDFADAGRQLDQMDDEAFARYGLGPRDVAVLRQRFAAWPRTAEAADRQLRADRSWQPQSRRDEAHPAGRGMSQEEPGTGAAPQRYQHEHGAEASRDDPEPGL
jgi:hypothetical protein